MKALIISLIILASLVPFLASRPVEAFGVCAPAGLPTGGMITFMYYACMVPPAFWIMLGPPSIGSYMYMPGTSQLCTVTPPSHTGQYVVGATGGYLPCNIYCGVSICTIGGGPLFLALGTSI